MVFSVVTTVVDEVCKEHSGLCPTDELSMRHLKKEILHFGGSSEDDQNAVNTIRSVSNGRHFIDSIRESIQLHAPS